MALALRAPNPDPPPEWAKGLLRHPPGGERRHAITPRGSARQAPEGDGQREFWGRLGRHEHTGLRGLWAMRTPEPANGDKHR